MQAYEQDFRGKTPVSVDVSGGVEVPFPYAYYNGGDLPELALTTLEYFQSVYLSSHYPSQLRLEYTLKNGKSNGPGAVEVYRPRPVLTQNAVF